MLSGRRTFTFEIILSGGMDSSAIAVLAASKYPGTMHAFTIGYPGWPWQDERHDARELADHLKMPFHELELSSDAVVDDFPTMVRFRDEPIADISGSSYYAVMKLARDHDVPVMLMGQGGDELFWGYDWTRDAVEQNFRKQALHDDGSVGLRDYIKVTAPPLSYTGGMRWLKGAAGIRAGLQRYSADRTSSADRMVFYDLVPEFQEAATLTPSLYSPDFARRITRDRPYDLFSTTRPWPQIDLRITRLVCETYLLVNGITQGDRLSMASSVELRLPLVDYRLVETVIGLRKTYTDFDLRPKKWLIDALKHIVPSFVITRPKRGFTPPWREWNRALFGRYGKELAEGYLVGQGVLRPDAARRLSRGIMLPSVQIPLAFEALVLETWCRQMQQTAPAPTA